ncbi:MAG: SH3 domain-containing protein [Oscillospiraceae bacterium]|jgi:uncharacterized protein YgiM (DUF1202 family)|nr:SH3 domain-containing protein [Oscillospiraceae bacterium]
MKRCLKIMLFIVIMAAMAMALTLITLAADSLETTDYVNLRSSASTNAGVVTTVSAGVSVEVLEHDPAGWSKVKLNSTTGYIRSDFLTMPAGAQSLVFKTTDGVNFRSGPSTDASVVSTLSRGTAVEVVEHDPAGWSKVRAGGTTGYIRSDFLSLTGVTAAGSQPTTLKTNDGVNFRKGPSTDSGVIKVLSANTEVKVLEQNSNGWSKVQHDGDTGYIRSDFLSKNGRTVELLDWSVVSKLIKYGEPIHVYDVRTGLTYYIACFSVGRHADVTTLTKEDTEIHSKTHNYVKSWNARPVWVTIAGHTIAASLHGMPHDVSFIAGNGMTGHICLHFLGSTTTSPSMSYRADLQNGVQEAWAAR